jgi:hypothetical protein
MPTFDSHANFVVTSVATPPSPALSGTSLVVATGSGAIFPDTPFNCIVFPVGGFPNVLNAEIVRVTNISSDTLTIIRAQEGSTARSIGATDIIALTVTAKTLTDIENLIGTTTGWTGTAHGFTVVNGLITGLA